MTAGPPVRTEAPAENRRRSPILLLAAFVLTAACGPPAVSPGPESAPAAPPAPPAPPAATPVDWRQPIHVCVVRDGELVRIPARYDPATDDTTTLEGLPFASAAPLTGEYAAVAGWYLNREEFRFGRVKYSPYGFPLVMAPEDLVRVGVHREVALYAKRADPHWAETAIYLPTRPGCEFHRYQFSGWVDES